MRTFLIATTCFVVFIAWLLHKPIPKQQPVVRAFSSSEIEYLEKSFYYAMDTLEEGKYLDWSAAAVNGRISAGKVYESGKHATCRKYVEVSRTHDAQKVDAGTACKRNGKDGWCRIVDKNAPESCALEVAENTLKKQSRYAILRGNQVLDNAWAAVTGIDTGGMVPGVPSVSLNTPSIGQVPEIHTPDIEPGDLRPPMPWDGDQQGN